MAELTKEELLEMKLKVDRIFEMLGQVLIPADTVTKTKGLNENTISRNNSIEKFNEFGKRKLLIEVKSVSVIKNRKRTKK